MSDALESAEPPPTFELCGLVGLDVVEHQRLTKAEKRKRRRATLKYRNLHASRERSVALIQPAPTMDVSRVRVESFNMAFASLRSLLPGYPLE